MGRRAIKAGPTVLTLGDKNKDEPFEADEYGATVYDYCMFSQNMPATRTGDKIDNNGMYTFVPERFTATFYYGAMGVVSRVDEKGDSDVTDNDENYYLTDATGNHVGMAVVNGSQRDAQFQYFDVSEMGVGLQPLEAM